jgi:SOS-response transcriptional repressor LexA
MRKKRARIYSNEDIYNFIVEFKKANDGNSPSLRNICDALGINSTSLVQNRLFELEEEGKIVCNATIPRFINVVGGKWAFSEHV